MAGAGVGAKMKEKVEPGPKLNNLGSTSLLKSTPT